MKKVLIWAFLFLSFVQLCEGQLMIQKNIFMVLNGVISKLQEKPWEEKGCFLRIQALEMDIQDFERIFFEFQAEDFILWLKYIRRTIFDASYIPSACNFDVIGEFFDFIYKDVQTYVMTIVDNSYHFGELLRDIIKSMMYEKYDEAGEALGEMFGFLFSLRQQQLFVISLCLI
eukprot:TRINITY_DN39065_c0_g1_i1.p1 TRINITY_DN39065_c0_g1~~TRINITY_DN39065_c0_g1_i1.p1  ORF type:complete len:173 (+),score=5.96 TRINITY_DN39065_c0_g1_i1:3-521(+)